MLVGYILTKISLSQIGASHENFKDILGGYLRISSAK